MLFENQPTFGDFLTSLKTSDFRCELGAGTHSTWRPHSCGRQGVFFQRALQRFLTLRQSYSVAGTRQSTPVPPTRRHTRFRKFLHSRNFQKARKSACGGSWRCQNTSRVYFAPLAHRLAIIRANFECCALKKFST